jgi:hypothetical protein
MDVLKPRWSSSSFLVYAGGFTISLAASYALTYLSSQYRAAAYAGWSLLVAAVLLALAVVWRERTPLTAGVLAVVSVGAFGGFVAASWEWFGWDTGGSPFGGFNVARLGATLLILLFAVMLAKRFRHPLLAYPIAVLSWFFFTDLISNGGNWSAFVSLFVGIVLLLVGVTIDRGARRPYGFWVHVVAGATFGGALIYWWHAGTWRWIFVVVGALAFVRIGEATRRSSWTVFGALGLLAATIHFTVDWWNQSVPFFGFGETTSAPRAWVPPVTFAVLGFVYLALAGVVSPRERR